MSMTNHELGRQAPAGFFFVAIAPEQTEASVRICVLASQKPDPTLGPWVTVRRTLDAVALLGALVDKGDVVHRWVEIWIQETVATADTPAGRRQPLTHALLDERWRSTVRALDELEPDLLIRTGYETVHPLPVYVDLRERAPVHPSYEGHAWRLCTDDALLIRRGLPAYASSLQRYWHVPEMGENTPFAAVSRGAPAQPGCLDPETALGSLARAAALNPEGGLTMVRTFAPFNAADFAETLGGRAWAGWRYGNTPLSLDSASESLKASSPSERPAHRFLFARQGATARLLEVFYLKIKLLADAVSAVRALVAQTRRPLLNLSHESFGVHLGDAASRLPVLWTARVTLRDGGVAIPHSASQTGAPGWLTPCDSAPSVYCPALSGPASRGRARVRIRKVSRTDQGKACIEGTFESPAMQAMGRNDLLWLRLPVTDGPLDLYVRAERDASLAVGEWRFRMNHAAGDPQKTDGLERIEGVMFADVSFDVLPGLNTPCDLYALGALAAAVLIRNRTTDLPTAWDGIISMGRQVAEEYDASKPMATRVRTLYERDARWPEIMGPRHLLYEPETPANDRDGTFRDLWMETLALMIRSIPGLGPDSRCRDFSDAPDDCPQAVFDDLAQGLEAMALNIRSRLVNDMGCNREIRERILNFRR